MSASAAAVLYAVVVGWNGSPSPDVPKLRYADDDAVEYARLFRDAGARVTLLTTLDDDSRALQADARPDGAPTRAALLAALARVDDEIAKSGVPGELYLVYSGHGDVDHGEGFVTLDGGRLTRSDLYDRVLAGRRAARTHVIVDACKSYYLVYARGVTRRPHDAPFVDARLPSQFPSVGFALSSSADTDSHEWEEYQGGIFSHEVRSALRGAADADRDGAVSYAELGAFVRRANEAIPNPRFRPRFTVVPPLAAAAGERTPMLAWAANGSGRSLLVDLPGRISVEDALGRRLLDAHLGAPATVHLPAGATLFVVRDPRDGGGERALPEGAEPLALSSLPAHPRRVAARGAIHEAFRHLFERPYDALAVADYLAHPSAAEALADAPPPVSRTRRALTIATAVLAGASGAAGLAASLTAVGIHGTAGSGSQVDRDVANGRIQALNGAAIGLYAVGGAAAVASAILGLWPAHPRFVVGPGPGTVGLGFAAPLP